MTSYLPSVRCFEPPGVGPISDDCYQILDSMPASTNRQMFGRAGAPGVTVGVPYDIYSGTWGITHPRSLVHHSFTSTLADMWVR